jgi:hypothetical protein
LFAAWRCLTISTGPEDGEERMPSSPYAHVWEFEVSSEAEEEFRHQYGVQGAWARLFRR